MKYIEKQLLNEKKKLEQELEKVRKRFKGIPKGKIHAKKNGKRIEYYYRQEDEMENDETVFQHIQGSNKKSKSKEYYVRKENIHIVKHIVQGDYDSCLLENIEKRLKAIEQFLSKYKKTNISKIYEKTSVYKRALLDNIILSDEEYVRRWESVKYEGKNFMDNTTEIYTNRGERVRSKSEKIIADRLLMLGIPYRYEYPVDLKDNVKVYPDFTLLNIDTKEEIYLEHCGRMDDPSYVDNLMFKLKSYEKNGIYLGVNLFITYENSRFPFNTKMLDELMAKLFCYSRHDFL